MKPTFQIWNEDCITGLAKYVADDTVHLTVTSIPFEELFQYSGKLEDVGNNGSTVDILAGRFALNMRFVVQELFRVTHPGCIACIHIQQLIAYKNQHGFMGRRDFRGGMVDVFGAQGFQWAGEFVIPKDPQRVANAMNLHSLQFKTGYGRDARLLAPVFNDYVLVFLKPGKPTCAPVRCLKHKTNKSGWLTTDDWVRDAHGIWTDILEIDVIDGATSKNFLNSVKEDKYERHVCPLQLSVIQRCIDLYTNPITLQPDSLVLDPFMGVGSTGYTALGGASPITKVTVSGGPRNVIGFELKESYCRQAVSRCTRLLTGQDVEPADAEKTLFPEEGAS